MLFHASVAAPPYSEGPFAGGDAQQFFEAQRAWVRETLIARAAAIRGQGVAVRWVLADGVPYEEIVKAAANEDADIIVIGTHGRCGIDRMLLGSVTDRVIRLRSMSSADRALGQRMSNGELILDASHGEGGGQILRTALALAVALRRPVRLARIRIRRQKPGLQPQHLTVVRALAAISDATVQGDALDSTELSFVPRGLHGGDYRFDVGAIKGSAGSVSLVFQALLLPLVFAETPSRLTLIGGTHVPWSPPIHYLAEVFLPALVTSGLHAALTLHRWGWYPAGGGEVEASIAPVRQVHGFTPPPPDAGVPIIGLSAVSRLPYSIAVRQRHRARERLAAAGLAARIAPGGSHRVQSWNYPLPGDLRPRRVYCARALRASR